MLRNRIIIIIITAGGDNRGLTRAMPLRNTSRRRDVTTTRHGAVHAPGPG